MVCRQLVRACERIKRVRASYTLRQNARPRTRCVEQALETSARSGLSVEIPPWSRQPPPQATKRAAGAPYTPFTPLLHLDYEFLAARCYSRQRARLKLPFDILLRIISVADRSTLAQLCLVCRALLFPAAMAFWEQLTLDTLAFPQQSRIECVSWRQTWVPHSPLTWHQYPHGMTLPKPMDRVRSLVMRRAEDSYAYTELKAFLPFLPSVEHLTLRFAGNERFSGPNTWAPFVDYLRVRPSTFLKSLKLVVDPPAAYGYLDLKCLIDLLSDLEFLRVDTSNAPTLQWGGVGPEDVAVSSCVLESLHTLELAHQGENWESVADLALACDNLKVFKYCLRRTQSPWRWVLESQIWNNLSEQLQVFRVTNISLDKTALRNIAARTHLRDLAFAPHRTAFRYVLKLL